MAIKSNGVMIHRTVPSVQPNNWQSELSTALSSVAELLAFTGMQSSDIPDLDTTDLDFPLRVPRGFARRIEYGNPDDPLLRQVLPSTREHLRSEFYSDDPLHESDAAVLPGLVHKYSSRVLLILTGACAINCRYCFRRHFPYQENRLDHSHLLAALDYVRSRPGINEIILSGGDPLLLRDEKLAQLLDAIADIPHIQRIRLHTRTPVVIPQRITPELTRLLGETRLKSIMVLHINHQNELDPALEPGLADLRRANVTLLNQSVLLKGVNDNVDTLCALSDTLFGFGIMPYYLHLLDKVQGAAHFDLEQTAARRLLGEVASRLPGYLVPRLAIEEPGKPAKTIIAPLL